MMCSQFTKGNIHDRVVTRYFAPTYKVKKFLLRISPVDDF